MDSILRQNMDSNFKAIVQDQKQTLEVFKKHLSNNNAKVVYIAGKVTGLPYKEVYQKFKTHQLKLENEGYVVINPCDYVAKDEDWLTAMKICLNLLQYADYFSVLPDWLFSQGARVEVNLAQSLGIKLVPSIQL